MNQFYWIQKLVNEVIRKKIHSFRKKNGNAENWLQLIYLHLCLHVHASICVFPSTERSTGINCAPRPPPQLPQKCSLYTNAPIKDGNVKTSLCYSVMKLFCHSFQSPQIASNRVLEPALGNSKKTEISTDRMTAPQHSSMCSLLILDQLRQCFRGISVQRTSVIPPSL